jgi:hypothetical protein
MAVLDQGFQKLDSIQV